MTTPRDPVQFTRESAERIANVVREAELTPRGGRALSFDAVMESRQRKVFRMATFTGAWAIGSSTVVTLRGSTATLSVQNLLVPIPANGQRNCAIARDGSAWYLVQPQWDASFALTGASLGSGGLDFTRVQVASLATASTVRISTTTCS